MIGYIGGHLAGSNRCEGRFAITISLRIALNLVTVPFQKSSNSCDHDVGS